MRVTVVKTFELTWFWRLCYNGINFPGVSTAANEFMFIVYVEITVQEEHGRRLR